MSAEKIRDTPPEIIDIGLVGKVKEINATLITSLMADGVIPVIAPTGVGDGGRPTTLTPTSWPARSRPPSLRKS